MEFSIKSGSPEKQRTGCVVVGVFESRKLTLAAELLDRASQGFIQEVMRRGDMEGKAGSSCLLHSVPGTLCDRVLLVGLGKEREFHEKAFAAAIRLAVKKTDETGSPDAVIFLTELGIRKRDITWRTRQASLIARDALYRFEQFKSKKDVDRRPLRKITFAVERRNELSAAELGVTQGSTIAEGMAVARTLGNLPPNVCHPTYLAEEVARLAEAFGFTQESLDQAALETLGMNSLLAVARGSHQPPRLLVMQHRGGPLDEKPVVLVGKGVTFDTGGISLKPSADMDEMKFDMCGAAGVIGTLCVAARLKLPINIVAIVPAVENMPGGGATRPGDIVTSMSGQTIEILNTDAEGRLILCDALTYAERFDPEIVIDVATLTGACVVALGHVASGLFANRDSLAADLLAAGETSLDRAWHLPLWDDYQDLLKSPFADMGNIGGRWGGAITAACFLSRFVKKVPWAHLDVAGTAYKSGSDKGATGRPVPLLTQYLLTRAGVDE